MFDFLRNLGKSDEEKIQEALTAYLDDALTPEERRRFEEQLAADEALRADLEAQRLVKANLGALPQVRAPRNFTLDPALYGRPQPAGRLYPALRTATVLAAILFVVVLTLDLAGTASPLRQAGAPAASEVSQVASEPEADLGFVDEAASVVEVTRIVEEEIVIEEAEEAVMEEAAEVELAAEAPAEEVVEEAPALEDTDTFAPSPAEPAAGDDRLSATPPLAESEAETFPQEGAAGGYPAGTEMLPAMTATPLPTPYPLATMSVAEALEAERQPDETEVTAEARALQSEPQAAAEAELVGEGRAITLPMLRILVVALGIVVILLTAGTLLARRRQ